MAFCPLTCNSFTTWCTFGTAAATLSARALRLRADLATQRYHVILHGVFYALMKLFRDESRVQIVPDRLVQFRIDGRRHGCDEMIANYGIPGLLLQ